MVASDTVVGLVGAGILLVALVGVFVYESQQGQAGSEDLATESFDTKGEGKVTVAAGTGTMPMGQCVPPGTCTPPKTEVKITISGLPEVKAGDVFYVAYLVGPSQPSLVGALTKTGEKYGIDKSTATSNIDKNALVISVETKADAPSPSFVIITYSGLTAGASGTTINKDVKVNFLGDAGPHTLSFGPEGGNTNVTAQLRKVPVKTGLAYRGWLMKDTDAGRSYDFIGNMSYNAGLLGGAKTTNGTITGSAIGAKNEYARFIVTLDAASKFDGSMPSGPIVIEADYNVRSTNVAP